MAYSNHPNPIALLPLDLREREVLHYGHSEGRYGRAAFRSSATHLQGQMNEFIGAHSPIDEEGLEVYAFAKAGAELRRYDLRNGDCLVLLVSDRNSHSAVVTKIKSSFGQTRELQTK